MPRLLASLRSFAKPLQSGYPRLAVLTDASRGFDIARQIADCPPRTLVIERTFGRPPLPRSSQDKKHLIRLATVHPRVARRAKLDGVHWPERRLRLRHRSKVCGLIETASAHRGLGIAKAQKLGIQAILLSIAFPSQSPSALAKGARPARGAIRLARLQRAFPNCNLYALGGIQAKTTRRLARTGLYGVALVSGLTD